MTHECEYIDTPPEHDYIDTSIWYKNVIIDPYQTIAEFFTAADIAYYRKTIRRAINVASSDKVWSKSSPGDLLWFFEKLESAINAAYLINMLKKKSPLSIGKEDVFNPNLYCGWHGGLTEWDFFPRSLSLKEYIDPYIAFKKFFKFRTLDEWKEELHEVMEFALGKTSFSEASVEFDTLPIYFHLTKVVEAAHLIDVREITHIGGSIKNRLKKKYPSFDQLT
jgi:hypothetical protein